MATDHDKIGARYDLLKHLSGNDTGDLYRAYDQRRQSEVLLMLAPKSSYPRQAIADFTYTAQTLAAMGHTDGIMPLVDFGNHQGQPYQVTPALSGETLEHILKSGPLNDERTLQMINFIAYALDQTHEAGIIHGAVMPTNILISYDGHDRLTNFGMITLVEAAGLYSKVLPAYMPPERADGGVITAQADVYALGITLYQCLTGELPYKATSRMMMVMAQVANPVPAIATIRPDLPAAVQRVINFALAKEPSVRYETAGELYNELAESMGA